MMVDMGIENDVIVDFAQFAKLQVEEHTIQLVKKYKKNAGIEKESLRLKVFNEQLHSLKIVLSHKVDELKVLLLADAHTKKELDKKYSQYINDFLKGDFDPKD